MRCVKVTTTTTTTTTTTATANVVTYFMLPKEEVIASVLSNEDRMLSKRSSMLRWCVFEVSASKEPGIGIGRDRQKTEGVE